MNSQLVTPIYTSRSNIYFQNLFTMPNSEGHELTAFCFCRKCGQTIKQKSIQVQQNIKLFLVCHSHMQKVNTTGQHESLAQHLV